MDLLSSGRGAAGEGTGSDGTEIRKDGGSDPEYNKEELKEVGETEEIGVEEGKESIVSLKIVEGIRDGEVREGEELR